MSKKKKQQLKMSQRMMKILNPIATGSERTVNRDTIIMYIGATVWAVCTIGQAYGLAKPIPFIDDFGKILFGAGLRGALSK
jgi:hypothetical protein